MVKEKFSLDFADYEKFRVALERIGRQAGLSAEEIAQLERSVADTGKSTRQNIGGLEGVLGGLKKQMVAAFAVGTLIEFGRAIIDTRKKVEAMENAIKAASGSSIAAQQNLRFLRQVTEELGLDAESAAQGFKTLLGSLQGTNISAGQAREIFKSTATAVSALGLSADDANGVFLAFGQILSKGKVSSEELRGQIGERLPGAMAIAARSVGKTQEEFVKLLESGKLISEEFLPKFAAELQKTFGGSVKTDGLTQSLNRLQTAYNSFLNSLGGQSQGVLTAITSGMATALSATGKFISGVSSASAEGAAKNRALADSATALQARYEELAEKGVNATTSEKAELAIITEKLRTAFGNEVVEIDKATNSYKLNLQALAEQIKLKKLLAEENVSDYVAQAQQAKAAQEAAARENKVAKLQYRDIKQNELGKLSDKSPEYLQQQARMFERNVTETPLMSDSENSKKERDNLVAARNVRNRIEESKKEFDKQTKLLDEALAQLKKAGFSEKEIKELTQPVAATTTDTGGGGAGSGRVTEEEKKKQAARLLALEQERLQAEKALQEAQGEERLRVLEKQLAVEEQIYKQRRELALNTTDKAAFVSTQPEIRESVQRQSGIVSSVSDELVSNVRAAGAKDKELLAAQEKTALLAAEGEERGRIETIYALKRKEQAQQEANAIAEIEQKTAEKLQQIQAQGQADRLADSEKFAAKQKELIQKQIDEIELAAANIKIDATVELANNIDTANAPLKGKTPTRKQTAQRDTAIETATNTAQRTILAAEIEAANKKLAIAGLSAQQIADIELQRAEKQKQLYALDVAASEQAEKQKVTARAKYAKMASAVATVGAIGSQAVGIAQGFADVGINNSLNENENNYQSELAALEEKYNAELELLDEKNDSELEKQKEFLDKKYEIESQYNEKIDEIKAAQAALEAENRAGLAQDFEYNTQLNTVKQQQAEQQKAQQLAALQADEQKHNREKQRGAEKERLERERQTKKEALEAQYETRRRQLLTQQAQSQKEAAIIQAVINTAIGVTAALTLQPVGYILAGVTAALGAAQIALIASQPVAKYNKGTPFVEGREGIDQVPAMLTRGERVVPRETNRVYYEDLEAIRRKEIAPGEIMKMVRAKKAAAAIEVIPTGSNSQIVNVQNGQDLGRVERLLKEIATKPQVIVQADAQGVWQVIKRGESEERVLNEKFKML